MGRGFSHPEFLHSNRSVVSPGLAGVVVQDYKRWVSSPLLGEAEAEGFGVGVPHEEATPALRDRCRCAPPLPRGDFRAYINTDTKFRFYICPPLARESKLSESFAAYLAAEGVETARNPVVPLRKRDKEEPDL